MTYVKLWPSAQHTKSPQQAGFILRQPLPDIPGVATTVKSTPTTQGTESMCRHGSRTPGVTSPDVCTPRTLLLASGTQRANSSRGKTTLRASTAQAPSGKYGACECRPRHLACKGLYFHSSGIPELYTCKACAAFPVVLISGVAPRGPSGGLRPISRISEHALPSSLHCALAQPLRARVLIQDSSAEGMSIATATSKTRSGRREESRPTF